MTSPNAPAPIAVVMISLNEAHHLRETLANLEGFASEVFLVDSFSTDATVDIALAHGVHVVQRGFRNFGDQWNFALRELPITSPWTMKLDPDERLSDHLKASIRDAVDADRADGLVLRRRLWFMGQKLPIRQNILRAWRTGACRFSDVAVNEQPLLSGRLEVITGELEHHDSPNLHHWYEKQNNYTTQEALSAWRGDKLSAQPRLLGSSLERRMWIKAVAYNAPFLPSLVLLYYLFVVGVWRAGWRGVTWAFLRREAYRMIRYKLREMRTLGQGYAPAQRGVGSPDMRVPQHD
jgi:glycosyltransferase involved in cell wall biosynthesis